MGIEIKFKLGDKIQDLKQRIANAYLEEVIDILIKDHSFYDNVNHDIYLLLNDKLKSSSEYSSLINGEGLQHFGFYFSRAQSMVDSIISIWLNSVSIKSNGITKAKTKPGIKFILTGIQSSYLDVLSDSNAIIPYRSRRYKKDLYVPWLEWFLKGNSNLEYFRLPINNYYLNTQLGKGRSRFANMIYTAGTSYDLPSSLKGNVNNNWIERVLLDSVDEINNILMKRMGEYFS